MSSSLPGSPGARFSGVLVDATKVTTGLLLGHNLFEPGGLLGLPRLLSRRLRRRRRGLSLLLGLPKLPLTPTLSPFLTLSKRGRPFLTRHSIDSEKIENWGGLLGSNITAS